MNKTNKNFYGVFILLIITIIILNSCSYKKGELDNSALSEVPVEIDDKEPNSSINDITEESEGQTNKIQIIEDLLTPLENYSEKRESKAEFVMLHFCSAVMIDFYNPYDLMTVRQMLIDYGASIHYVVDRDGTIYRYVAEDRVAWHAGKGTWNNDKKYSDNMNKYSIGIEILAIGSEKDMSIYLTKEEYEKLDRSLIGYTEEQYDSLYKLVDYICVNNNIPKDRDHVIGHQEYKPSKNDPGELFDWARVMNKQD